MNILITGSDGQLGKEFRMLSIKAPKPIHRYIFANKNDMDITDAKNIENFIEKNSINIIINCAAYTKVDKAEEEKGIADMINHTAINNLSSICRKRDIPLIHISTDYVFDGKNSKPYNETDKTNPKCFYGVTKLKGEIAFADSKAKGVIIRTSWLYGKYGENFVNKMIKLPNKNKKLDVVFDQIGTPTYSKDLALAIVHIVNNHFDKLNRFEAEIFHYSNEGVASWYDLSKAIFEIENIGIKLNPIESKHLYAKAKRPHYSVLNKEKIKKEFGLTIPYWRDSLKIYLGNIK